MLGIIGLLDGQCRCVRGMENCTHKHVETACFVLTYTDVILQELLERSLVTKPYILNFRHEFAPRLEQDSD